MFFSFSIPFAVLLLSVRIMQLKNYGIKAKL